MLCLIFYPYTCAYFYYSMKLLKRDLVRSRNACMYWILCVKIVNRTNHLQIWTSDLRKCLYQSFDSRTLESFRSTYSVRQSVLHLSQWAGQLFHAWCSCWNYFLRDLKMYLYRHFTLPWFGTLSSPSVGWFGDIEVIIWNLWPSKMSTSNVDIVNHGFKSSICILSHTSYLGGYDGEL